MARKPSQGNALQELKTALKNKELGRLYFFHGEETFLLNHYLLQMKKQLLDELCRRYPNARDQMLSALLNQDQYGLWNH